MFSTDAARLRWRSGTRFGRLVVPLVCRTSATSSGPGMVAVRPCCRGDWLVRATVPSASSAISISKASLRRARAPPGAAHGADHPPRPAWGGRQRGRRGGDGRRGGRRGGGAGGGRGGRAGGVGGGRGAAPARGGALSVSAGGKGWSPRHLR